MKKQHWILRWLFITILIVLFGSYVNPLIRRSLPPVQETRAERIYRQYIAPWIEDMRTVSKYGDDPCPLNVEGWSELTEKEQDDFRRFIVYRSSQDIFPMDVTEGMIPVVLYETIGSLNGVLRIKEDGLLILEHDEKAKKMLEPYLCKNCGGTGIALAPRDSCTDCYGTGTITIKCAKYNPETGWEDVNIPCYSCPDDVCPVCHGIRYCPVEEVK